MTGTVKIGFISLALAAGITFSATAQMLPLEEVTLYTSGVAEYVHRGVPDETGVIALSVVGDRIADVVRSVTVLDAGGRPVTDI
ncbi:MAG: hypothetical protein PF508_02255, partial [Spirochaeta sp.]|nr:hypothetical protein [Spirochaeta sp.]